MHDVADQRHAPPSGSVINHGVHVRGLHHAPSHQIKLEVLKDPTFNPSTASNWVQFATATSSASPFDAGDAANPLYYWTTSAPPVPNATVAARWPQGGLVRIRGRDPSPPNGSDGLLVTFDAATFDACFDEHSGESWEAIGTACAGTGGKVATFVSTTDTPTGGATGFLGRKGDISEAETNQYYAAIDAPLDLGTFKTRYGFTSSDIHATYYNDGDLGLGREMHCKAFPGANGTGIACYVRNYSGIDDVGDFTQPYPAVLTQAVTHLHSFATVAMVYDPPLHAANSVKFMVYDAGEQLTPVAALDSTGVHHSVPNNCIACHGIKSQYNATSNSITDAQFLPFDVFSYKYSPTVGYRYADQATAFRQLNALVTLTSPTTAIGDFITGMYAPKLVTDPTAVANNDYVPSGWQDKYTNELDGPAIYRGVVKVGCRTCHMSSTDAALDFKSASDFDANPTKALILGDVCTGEHADAARRTRDAAILAEWRAGLPDVDLQVGRVSDAAMACKP